MEIMTPHSFMGGFSEEDVASTLHFRPDNHNFNTDHCEDLTFVLHPDTNL
jgi:hypothetical protein